VRAHRDHSVTGVVDVDVDTVITGGMVATADREPFRADVAIVDGKISHVWDPRSEPDAGPNGGRTAVKAHETVDATGLLVLPGTQKLQPIATVRCACCGLRASLRSNPSLYLSTRL
jgi:hypothetical protein